MWLIAVLAIAGCGDELCARRSDCSAGQVCTAAGVCELAPDAGPDDGDVNDAGQAAGHGGPR